MKRVSTCLSLFTAIIFSACQGSSAGSTVKAANAPRGTLQSAPVINLGDSLRLAGNCQSELSSIKIYVGEQFLQGPSPVLINLILNNHDLGVDALVMAVGEFVLNETTQSFQYVIKHKGQEVARLALSEVEGVPSQLLGPISIEEIEATCK